uniref:Uncharacterized protein n=2 Tax=Neobodo designis TaxID=312471 RepID=A0A7S1MIG2_NEODS|mmetsp:Transcript_41107/g.126933  ORF Transcript_41107/g.126933 Transcript_41107/m.126933 type:complete len:244 (+) Transcript_41107:91-822(+)
MDDPTDPEEQRQLIDRFYKKTYYQYLREMGSKLSRKTFVFESTERTKDKQMRILNRVVTYWQRYTVERMFKGWRGYIRGRREKRKMADEIARVRKQLDDATERVGSVASEKEVALERAIQLNESANTELQRVQDRCSRLEWRNDELEAAAREMNKRFEEDARVKKLVQEIAHLRKANAKLLAAAGGDAHEASVESAGGAPEEATEMSFVISDATDIAEVQKLRGELAAAKARIAQLEQQQQAP